MKMWQTKLFPPGITHEYTLAILDLLWSSLNARKVKKSVVLSHVSMHVYIRRFCTNIFYFYFYCMRTAPCQVQNGWCVIWGIYSKLTLSFSSHRRPTVGICFAGSCTRNCLHYSRGNTGCCVHRCFSVGYHAYRNDCNYYSCEYTPALHAFFKTIFWGPLTFIIHTQIRCSRL